jgi:hypothetical protein
MGWNKDGNTIKAVYLDRPITGVVLNSRVKYGGQVQYQVKLDEPVYLPWSAGEPRDIVLVDENDVIADFGIMIDLEENL